MVAGSTRVGGAWYELSANDAKLKAALTSADKTIQQTGDAAGKGFATRFSSSLAGIKQSIGSIVPMVGALGAAFAATKMVSFLGDAISAASDLGETVSKVGVIFGSEALAGLEEWAEGAAAAMGQSKQQALDAAATFAIFGKSAGLAGSDLVGFSTELVELSSDLASFHNVEPQEVIEAMGAALRGEAEPMRRFGVLLDDATLRAKALEMGLISTTKNALTPQQKVLAAQAVILEQTGDAQGDFARTSGGLANQQRILSAQLENASARMGQMLLPAMTAVARLAVDVLIPAITAIGTMIGKLLEGIAFLTPGLVALGLVIGTMLVPAFAAWAVAAGLAAAATIAAMLPILVPIAAVAAAVLGVTLAFNSLTGVMGNFAMDFGEQGDRIHQIADATGNDFQVVKDRIKEYMAETGASFAEAADAIAYELGQLPEDAKNAALGAMLAMENQIKLGGPVVAKEAGKVAGLLPSEIKARDAEIRAAAYNNIVEFAAGVLDAQNQPKLAFDALVAAQDTALTRAAEIAYLKGLLSSAELAAGLNDERPAVSLAAQAAVTEINNRLAVLGADGYTKGEAGGAGVVRGMDAQRPNAGAAGARLRGSAIAPIDQLPGAANTAGVRTGSNLATGIGSQYYFVRDKSSGVASATYPLKNLQNSSYSWGKHLGENFAWGIDSAGRLVSDMAWALAGKAAGPIRFSRPPSFGPLSKIDEFGVHMAERYARSIGRGQGLIAGAALGWSGAVSGALRSADTISRTGPIRAMVQAQMPIGAVAGSVAGGSSPRTTTFGGPLVHIEHFHGTDTEIDQISRKLGTQIRLRASSAFK